MDHAEKVQALCEISDMVDRMQPCGSRVTCNPPPMDTDEDYLLLIGDKWPAGANLDVIPADEREMELEMHLRANGWEMGGSLPNDMKVEVPSHVKFSSWTKDELNLIITTSEEFFRRHLAATHIAKHLNLLHKRERIMLFQAVLYGNIVEPY
jgi:hypothetical protein